jgi:hypothetical protein
MTPVDLRKPNMLMSESPRSKISKTKDSVANLSASKPGNLLQ